MKLPKIPPTARRILLLVGGAAAPVLAVAFLLPTCPLTDEDKIQAARDVVAWIAENKHLPGSREEYADAEQMASRNHFVVVCDFMPEGESIGTDKRVQRVSSAEYARLEKEQGFKDETEYLILDLKKDTDGSLVLEASNMFGPLGGQGYRIVFRKKMWGLQAEAKFLWVA